MTQVENELMHYGILGMRWGKRMARGHAGPGVRVGAQRKNATIKDDRKTLNNGGHLSVGLTKQRQASYDTRDKNALDTAEAKLSAKDAKNQERRMKRAEKSDQRNERKKRITEQAYKLNQEASVADVLTYNNATRRKAAKYIVDKNMSVAEAMRKAQGDAWRNTAIFVAGYGAITVASLALAKG